ncbi:aldo/keto reductase [Paucilactobacillus hokkaidonensis JCM 18461]|uniref:Aldo/keto reductase n=2 Tax=Paucilactobacillus hokkaidonensis TaxID=1193095 RepID=A0A0A1GWC1_9LACO|nr:aldo/keto reductase [Paucilactobacillus hokkaidonensis]KRO11085.1 aldo keto reductase [Paucilactobacillus hokkaidonensis]BAP86552.1 aldo/keto reductase [Paucilactobacillus hokkaidonensis JCM 18461]
MNVSDNLLTLADGNQMPQQGFGVYKITDHQEFVNSIKAAWQAGYRLFDTAQMYENEQFLGEALTKLQAPRSEIFITTKVSETNQGYENTIKSVKESLTKLQTDYVDLLLIHWPINTEFFETWRAFEDLKKAGLTRSIGVSNYGMVHLQYLATQAHELPVVNQIEVSPYMSQKPLLKFQQEHNIVTQAWSPLGRGKIFDDPTLVKIAQGKNRSVAQVVLRWHLQNGVAIIPKSVHAARINENAAIYDFTLTNEEMTIMDSVNKNHRISKEPELVYEFGEQYPY